MVLQILSNDYFQINQSPKNLENFLQQYIKRADSCELLNRTTLKLSQEDGELHDLW